ncbi:MAG: hypothetical protein ACPLN0_00910 [Candidatus Hydrothermia bacterium]
MIFFILLLSQVSLSTPEKAVIKIQTAIRDTYAVVTKDKPYTFVIEGPTWVRVYTRLLWKKDYGKSTRYKLILVKDNTDERFITRETEPSKVAYLGTTRLSKWRSFYIQVPEGKHTYEIYIWKAPLDTVLVKLSYEAPQNFTDIVPEPGFKPVEIIENEKIIKYYEFSAQNPLKVKIEGPARVKATIRVPLKSLEEQATYTLMAKRDNKLIKESTFSVKPSDTSKFKEIKDAVPSTPSKMFVDIKKGEHIIEFSLKGIEKAFVRLQVQKK